jgi:transposase
MLTARRLVQSKLRDVESYLRGILRGFGLKVGTLASRSPPPRSRSPPSTFALNLT